MIRISVPTNRTLSSTGPLSVQRKHCLCSENVAIGFKTSIEAYFMEKTHDIQGYIQDFFQGGANLEYVKKRGGEAVRSCRAAAGQPQGGGCRRGMCPLPHKIFTYLRSIYMSCDMV